MMGTILLRMLYIDGTKGFQNDFWQRVASAGMSIQSCSLWAITLHQLCKLRVRKTEGADLEAQRWRDCKPKVGARPPYFAFSTWGSIFSKTVQHGLITVERISYRLTALLMALCEVRNTKIVSAFDIGKDLSIMAEFEFLRKEALIETNAEYKEATEAMQSTWDNLAIETHSKLCGLRKAMKGTNMIGNQNARLYNF